MSELVEQIKKAIIEGDKEASVATANEAIKAGVDLDGFIKKGMTVAMQTVGDKFENFEYFLADMMLSADAMTEAMNVLEPKLKENKIEANIGTVVLGTVAGDIHDIGKNIFKVMLDVAGFKVYDLGKEVMPTRFIEEAMAKNADVIAESALLSTSIPYMEELDRVLRERGLRDKFKIVVGGGPITQEIADSLNADGYGINAQEGVEVIKKLLGK